MNISLPTGATATINGGASFSGEKQLTVTPLVDFYRLTITAADGTTEKSYYFVTRYYLTGVPIDLVRAIGTFVFLRLGAVPMLEKLDRIKVKYGLAE